VTTRRISQLRFSFYHHRPVHCDFSGGQITSDAGLLPLRAFDERHHLTRGWAALLSDPRDDKRVCRDSLELGSQPTLSRRENAPSARDLVRLNDALLDQFLLCVKQVRQRGEILLDIDSTDDPTHGQQQLSIFNGAYDQHMYHPMLIFERHTGCLLAARLRQRSNESSIDGTQLL
jgi:hypothetical protein